MADAPVGDDVYGEDPTVNRLESMAAERLGHEAALFAPTGTQTNLLGILSHCERGDEYIVGQVAHTYPRRRWRRGGAGQHSAAATRLRARRHARSGASVASVPSSRTTFHFARTRLLCLENTQAGKVLPIEYLGAARRSRERARTRPAPRRRARVQRGGEARRAGAETIGREFDSVSFCLSKGLGAPVGSLLTGSPGNHRSGPALA